MKPLILTYLLMLTYCFSNGQNTIQTINSGGLITSNSLVSIGEIVIIPQNQTQASSGLIGIVSQMNQNLNTTSFEITENITVFPYPTIAKLNFNASVSLLGEKLSIFDTNGKLIIQSEIEKDNSIELSMLPSGIYLIKFENKNYKTFKIIKN